MKQRFTLNNRGGSRVSLFVLIALLVGTGAAALNRQNLYDYFRLRNYTPSAEIVQLATDSAMKPSTRRIFYVNHPELQEKPTFKIDCPNGGGEKTIVLGCYKGGQNGIYLLRVSDDRLKGVEQVTAAHELLHAVYDRLSSRERTKVDTMLTDFYQNKLTDQRIKDTIDGYKKSEPNDVVNEMHSIFATEVGSLPAELETYYSQYFTDRAQVIKLANQYQNEFTSRQAAIEQADKDLEALKQRISTAEATLGRQQSQISSRQQQLVSRQRGGDTEGYNQGVAGYNASIDEYNRQVRAVQQQVNQYNALVASRNALAAEITELSGALSTDAAQIKQ